MKCPECKHKIDDSEIVSEAARINGSRTSPAKKKACVKNGKKGGRKPKANLDQ